MLFEIIDEDYKKQIIFLLNNNWTGRTDYYFPAQETKIFACIELKSAFN